MLTVVIGIVAVFIAFTFFPQKTENTAALPTATPLATASPGASPR